jgi:hypothetical protein
VWVERFSAKLVRSPRFRTISQYRREAVISGRWKARSKTERQPGPPPNQPASVGCHAHFFRKRLALATARECQGARSEAIVALPLPETSRIADLAAASAFSFAIRRYSAGEQSFCNIKMERRVIVSQDASIRSLIITAGDN